MKRQGWQLGGSQERWTAVAREGSEGLEVELAGLVGGDVGHGGGRVTGDS